MSFVIAVGVVILALLVTAALVDRSTRKSGRQPRRAGEIRSMVRDGRRDMWRKRLRGTKFETLVPGSESKARPYGEPGNGVYEMPDEPQRPDRDR